MKNRLASLQRRHDRNRGTFVVSAVVHGLVFAVLAFFAGRAVKKHIDEAAVIKTFRAPPPPPPPPPGGHKKKTQKTIEKPKTVELIIPKEVPKEVPKTEEEPTQETETDAPDDGGVEGGVEGGVVGGVVGGVIGGTVGGVLGNPLPEGPVSNEPRRITSDITPPEQISRVEPEYPMIAKRAHIQGEVILECIIDESGNVTISKVLKPVAMVQSAAEDAVKQWKYKPAMLNGRPQAVFLTVRVKFNLSG